MVQKQEKLCHVESVFNFLKVWENRISRNDSNTKYLGQIATEERDLYCYSICQESDLQYSQ